VSVRAYFKSFFFAKQNLTRNHGMNLVTKAILVRAQFAHEVGLVLNSNYIKRIAKDLCAIFVL
jgi:hypothetical protein